MSFYYYAFRLSYLAAGIAVILAASAVHAKPPRVPSATNAPPSLVVPSVTVNLSDFAPAGDGVTDDGPAFQRALDAIAVAGGGTLLVPAGQYLIATPVVRNFSSINDATLVIRGVPSDVMPAPPTATGSELSAGLSLTSEIIPATGSIQNALTLSHLHQLSIEHMVFTGRENQMTDAFITLSLEDVDNARIHHCEFYGVSSFGIITELGGGNIIRAVRSDLSIELSVFLGCTASSGAYAAVVSNLEWKRFSITNSIFLDYGRRTFFSKTGLGAPLSWLDIGNAAAITPDSPRREFIVRDTFLDEGGWVGISALPRRWGPFVPIDLLYISGLKMNVSNMGTVGHLLYDVSHVMIENSHYGWSHNAYAAIDIYRSKDVILDKLTCIDHADRLRIDGTVDHFTVINSQYNQLDSWAQTTTVLNMPDAEDPVQFVRQQFLEALGRQPDPAAHFYWTNKLLGCAQDNECLNQQRATLSEYLGNQPHATFSIIGDVIDADGNPIGETSVTLTGSQSVAATTDSDGKFQFSNLPTSGVYTVAVDKQHYTFAGTQTYTHPAADVTPLFRGTLNRHSISGQITGGNGAVVSGVTVQLMGSTIAPVLTDVAGSYSFTDVPAGGNYTVLPSLSEFAFTPATKTFQDLSTDQAAHFIAARTHIAIDGTITDEQGNPLRDATVSLMGSQSATVLTNQEGKFRFTSLPTSGTYTVTVDKRHFTFSPNNQAIVTPADNVAMLFTATLNRHSINGRITNSDGNAIGGIALQLAESPAIQVTTNADGNFSFSDLPAGGNYTIVPSSTDYVFTPLNKTFEDLSANQVVNFCGEVRTVSIEGSVVDENGDPLAGTNVSLTGSQTAAAVTDLEGNFRFLDLPTTGNYTFAVSRNHYHFEITQQTFERPATNVSVTFNARLNRHSINGRITRANGAPAGGVQLQLDQSTVPSVTTDANGYYSFAGLAAGGNYTVVPSSLDLGFTPANKTFQDLSADQTSDFSAVLRPVLLTMPTSDLAIALDSLVFTAQPFSILSALSSGPAQVNRVMVFANQIEPSSASQLSVTAEDETGNVYPLQLEYMGDVAGQSWLKQLNIKLSSNLQSDRCVKLRLFVSNVSSNAARICLVK